MTDILPRGKSNPPYPPPVPGRKIVRLFGLVLFVLSFSAASHQEKPRLDATVELHALSGSGVQGKLHMQQRDTQVVITGEVKGLTPGRHGIHVHTNGDCDSPGGHYNPTGVRHGGPVDPHAHIGDLGNIEADPSGRAIVQLSSERISLTIFGMNSVIDRSIVIHANEDDLKSDPDGNSGVNVACGFIEQDMVRM